MGETKKDKDEVESVDQGFNDAELEEIMSEIEGLEDDVASDTDTSSSSTTDDVPEMSGESVAVVPPVKEVVNAIEEVKEEVKEVELKETRPLEQSAEVSAEVPAEVPAEVQEEVAEEKIVSPQPQPQPQPQVSNVVNMPSELTRPPSPGTTCPSKIDFSVSGDMTVALSLSVSGETVVINIDGKEGLTISCQSGAKFIIPLNLLGSKLKSAG